MEINFDVVMNTPGDTVDMKAGLDSLQGISDATRKIAETVLTKKKVERLSHKSSVRTKLKRSFKGSYGQIFSLEISGGDGDLERRARRLKVRVLVELLNYFMAEAIYVESDPLSVDAESRIASMGDVAEDLIVDLRRGCMESIHEVPRKFGYSLSMNFRKNSNDRMEIASFSENSSAMLTAELSIEQEDLKVAITRLNINTGNGRFQVLGRVGTVAFGFHGGYSVVAMESKKVISENLNDNNGLDEADRKYLNVSASAIKLHDGSVVKYIVRGVG